MFKRLYVLVLASTAHALFAQIPAPLAPEQIVYRHWPEQFVQWVGPELPYTMIELYVDPGSAPSPLYDAVLTERSTGKRVHYTNQQQQLEIDKSGGTEAYITTMQLDRPATARPGASYLLRFVDHAGNPVSWQFVQGSDVSERGGGLSPIAADPAMLLFRERSAVAGEGSALKIGNQVSTADVWTEISQPPYFVAYRGALTENVEIAVFAGTTQQWKTLSAPATLSPGATWSLQSQDGVGRTLKVKSLQGERAVILDNDEHFPRSRMTLEASWAAGAWTVTQIHYGPDDAEIEKEGMTFIFDPGLGSATGDTKFEVTAGHKARIAGGLLRGDADAMRWEFKEPQWLRRKAISVGRVTVRQREVSLPPMDGVTKGGGAGRSY
jgi:hypothetical protein